MAVKVASYKIIDSLLVNLMQILEFVGGRELFDVETVGKDTVWLALEQMLTLVCSNVRDCCKDIGRVCRSTLDAVPVVDTTLAGLGITVKVLKVVVEINRSSAQISSEESSMGGEDGGDIYSSLLAKR